jgi:LDH2 family malate/lactate/ureidoglycolate dehydrogenase
VDGDSALGMVTSVFAMTTAIAKARQAGVGYVGVRNSSHFGAAGYYAALAARDGLIGLAMANDIPSVAAPGSRTAVTGSNPLAYAVPAVRHQPLMLDMSIATVAGGKVYAARERGEPIPATWLIGEDGLPTDDPASYPEHSVLTPAAAHKGFGLALLIESLAGGLTGAAPTAPGTGRLLVPGEIEWGRFEAAQEHGIELPSDVLASLRESAGIAGLDLAGYLAHEA